VTLNLRRQLIADVLRPYDTGHELIRVGAFGDGGYLVPNDFNGIRACFSPGVSIQSTFEYDLAKRSIPSFMADASVDAPAEPVPGAIFRKKFVGPETKGDFISLRDWMDEFAPRSGDLILQMDIEGAEYAAIAALPSEYLKRFRIIVIELHRIPSILMKPNFFARAEPFLRAMAAEFTNAHLHTNNAAGTVCIDDVEFPRVVEATFIRNDRVRSKKPITTLPHELDVPHQKNRPDIGVPHEWLGDPDS